MHPVPSSSLLDQRRPAQQALETPNRGKVIRSGGKGERERERCAWGGGCQQVERELKNHFCVSLSSPIRSLASSRVAPLLASYLRAGKQGGVATCQGRRCTGIGDQGIQTRVEVRGPPSLQPLLAMSIRRPNFSLSPVNFSSSMAVGTSLSSSSPTPRQPHLPRPHENTRASIAAVRMCCTPAAMTAHLEPRKCPASTHFGRGLICLSP